LDIGLFSVLSDSNYGVVRTPGIRTKSIWTPVSEQVMIQKKLGLESHSDKRNSGFSAIQTMVVWTSIIWTLV
jgi:hypothetical protein